MASVRTHLWFGNDRAAEAAQFYADHLPDSTVGRVKSGRRRRRAWCGRIVRRQWRYRYKHSAPIWSTWRMRMR